MKSHRVTQIAYAITLVVLAGCVPEESDLEPGELDEALLAGDYEPSEPVLSGSISPAPRNLRVTANYGGIVIQLAFDCGGNASLHESFRQLDGGAWYKLRDECTDNGLSGLIYDGSVGPVRNYCYRVKASNSTNTAWSNTVCVTSDRYRTPPTAPTASVGEITKTEITIQAKDNSNTEAGFRLYRRPAGTTTWVYRRSGLYHPGTGTILRFHDGDITLGTTYEYKVNAYHAWDSADSNVVTAKAFPTKPNAPDITEFTDVGAHEITVRWRDNSNNEEGFEVRVTDWDTAGADTKCFQVGANTTSKRVSFLKANTTYHFEVRAYNKTGYDGDSAYMDTLAEMPATAPPDLVPLEVFLTPIFPAPGQAMTFQWTECNTGGTASGSYTTRVDLDGTQVQSSSFASLAPGECQLRTLNRSGVSAGSHAFDVYTDIGNTVAESYESNNTSHLGFDVI